MFIVYVYVDFEFGNKLVYTKKRYEKVLSKAPNTQTVFRIGFNQKLRL